MESINRYIGSPTEGEMADSLGGAVTWLGRFRQAQIEDKIILCFEVDKKDLMTKSGQTGYFALVKEIENVIEKHIKDRS